MIPRSRFAPSPTGMIHLGNARTALFSYLFACSEGAEFILRIEDTDKERSDMSYVDALIKDLQWLGIQWAAGPSVIHAADDTLGPYYQSQREDLYQRHCQKLLDDGKAYPCFCTQAELENMRHAQAKAGRPPRYDGRCARLSGEEVTKRLASDAPHTIRFRIPQNQEVVFQDLVKGRQRFKTADIGDFIMVKEDGSAAFFFSNAVDDAEMCVTHVFRGEDHLANTPRQLLLLEALGLAKPDYGHLNLITGSDGAPLSKRNGSRSISVLREENYLPIAIVNYMARLGHHYEDTDLLTMQQLVESFSIQHFGISASRFDEVQLQYWQGQALKLSSDEALWAWLGDAVQSLVSVEKKPLFLEIARTNVTQQAQAIELARSLCQPFDDHSDDYLDVHCSADAIAVLQDTGLDFYQTLLDVINQDTILAVSPPELWKALTDGVKQVTGRKGKALFLPMRAGITGLSRGPEMNRACALIGRAEISRRIKKLVSLLQ